MHEFIQKGLTYVIFGIIFTMIWDFVLQKVSKDENDNELNLRNGERIVSVLIWPVLLLMLIINTTTMIIKSMFKK